jgi:hypothetical protein
MIGVVVGLLAWQAKVPTVGDTVWIETRVRVPPRMILRPQPWDLGTEGQLLGPPEVVYDADSATVRYPIAIWTAGEHQLTVPGPIVVSPEGKSDTLPNGARRVLVESVLPANTPKAKLSPRDPAARLAQTGASLLPLGIALLLAGATVGAGAAILWRRESRRKVTPPAAPIARPDFVAEVDAWAGFGEVRSALDGWSHLIEAELDRRADPAAHAGATPLLEALALAGFRPRLPPDESTRLLRAARDWWNRPR